MRMGGMFDCPYRRQAMSESRKTSLSWSNLAFQKLLVKFFVTIGCDLQGQMWLLHVTFFFQLSVFLLSKFWLDSNNRDLKQVHFSEPTCQSNQGLKISAQYLQYESMLERLFNLSLLAGFSAHVFQSELSSVAKTFDLFPKSIQKDVTYQALQKSHVSS